MRILYLMHIDWRWIKQRPHFLAEQLARRHDLRVLYRVHPKHFSFPASSTTVRVAPLLPLPRRLPAPLTPLANALQRQWIRAIAGAEPDLIWLTFPTLLDYVPRHLHRRIVYDCMDDAASFFSNPDEVARITRLERDLCRTASRIFCSSQHLVARLTERAQLESEPVLVRNAVSEAWLDSVATGTSTPAADEVSIGYIGTISEWFDIDAVNVLLDAEPKLRLHLVGPVAGVSAKRLMHPRIVLHGGVAHDQLARIASSFDAFIMPFKRSPLIEGVDPVKLYEYLAFGKPVLSIAYPEIERFGDYVYFYESRETLLALGRQLVRRDLAAKATAERCKAFIAANTWSSRASIIDAALATAGTGA